MPEERKKILITGSGGFIMSSFIRSAIYYEKPWTLSGIDKVSTFRNKGYTSKNNSNYLGDITDEHILCRVVEQEEPDIILHAAAKTSVDEAINNPSDYVRNNVMGTQAVLNVVVKCKVPRVIYVSTDEVYGALTSEDDKPWTEESPLQPRNTYSASKAAGEHLVAAYGASHKINYNIIRMANNYGARQSPEKFIPRIIDSVFAGRKIPIYGKGQQMRDWLHVADSYAAIATIIEKGFPGEAYNIGAGQEFSNLEVAQIVCSQMQCEMSAEFIPDRLGHDFRYSLNCDKIKKLGWEPKIKFRDGIKDAVEWFNINRYWFRKE